MPAGAVHVLQLRLPPARGAFPDGFPHASLLPGRTAAPRVGPGPHDAASGVRERTEPGFGARG